MYALDRASTGAREISWFHQLLDGKSARPPKSSDNLTVLRAGGAGGSGGDGAGCCGAGEGVGEGEGDGAGDGDDGVGDDSVDSVVVSLVALGKDEGAAGVSAGPPPQLDISPPTTIERAARRNNTTKGATAVPARISRNCADLNLRIPIEMTTFDPTLRLVVQALL